MEQYISIMTAEPVQLSNQLLHLKHMKTEQ